jgi:hypothetical protein
MKPVAVRRRELLQGATATGLLLTAASGLEACVEERVLCCQPVPSAPQTQTTGVLEETAAWLVEAPREGLFDEVVARLNGGLTIDELADASFLASLRSVESSQNNHTALLGSAMRALTAERGTSRRLAGELFTIDVLKSDQLEVPPLLQLEDVEPVDGDASAPLFAEGFLDNDFETTERAAVAIFRDSGRDGLFQLLWHFGARDLSHTGHKFIAINQYFRSLDAMGWEHGEGPIRSLVRRLMYRFEIDRPADGRYADFGTNAVKSPPEGWLEFERDDEVALTFLDELRSGSPQDASDAVVDHLTAGASPDSLWDGLVLNACEAVFHGSSVGNNLHKLTATHALRSGYLSVQDESLRLLILLQAACFSRRFGLDESPWALMDTVKPSSRPTLGSPAEVFDALDRTRPEPGPNGHAADEAPDFNTQHTAAADLMALLAADPNAFEAFVTETSDILREKAVAAHEYKYPYAIFEEAGRVGPTLRDRVAAMSVYFLPGRNATAWPALAEADAAIAKQT